MTTEENARLIPFTEELCFGPQPSTLQLQNLKLIGVKSVMNLRMSEEQGFIANEKEICESQGIQYAQLGVWEATDMTLEYVDQVVQKIVEMPAPVLVHCKVGLCACIVAVLKEAKAAGAGPEDALKWANDLGYSLANHSKVYQLVKDYLNK